MNRLIPTFAEPQWVHAIWLVAAGVALLVWLDRRGSRALDRFLSPLMQRRLVVRPQRRWLAIGLIGLAGLCLVIALMRPQWGRHFVKTPRVGAQIMICLDVSRSMLAEDTAPNRLERAKAEITDLLTYLKDDSVGLIAFAGRASVLCPLTPDFGFYRMVLDSVGPHSVARGGTNLEAPIREALEGFRDAENISRAIMLITDGEDHDSHPLDAAKAAAERGIRIITIGFGDEAGSPIYVTDPRTGARTQVRDADGQPVITRLDGEMLRKIALETDGAYIPAGTGVLNLKSIYDAHIAPLTRGRLEDQGRLVKREGFQWPLLGALIALLAAAIVAGRTAPPPAAIAMLCLLVVMPAPAARAAETGDPRGIYNQALALLHEGKLDEADRQFLEARRQAKTDVATSFRATYNLGWVEVKRADAVLEKEPEKALEHLQRAADWFRDAVRLQPESREARENLQILSERILALADSLRKEDEKDLARRLDELIDAQRGLTASARSAVERVAELENPNLPESLVSAFKTLEAEQRRIIGDLDRFMQDAAAEIEQLRAIEEEKRTPEQSMRFAQLGNMMHYLHGASQRVGQARQQFRQRQAERGYRRASAGLERLKQARDMLRNIVQVLNMLVTDAAGLTRHTALLATSRPAGLPVAIGSPDTASTAPAPPDTTMTAAPATAPSTAPTMAATAPASALPELPVIPAWLTHEWAAEQHESLVERTDVLFARMDAGIKAGQQQPPEDADQQRMLEHVTQAAPLVAQARDAFRAALENLQAGSSQEAFEADVRGLKQLAAAREFFLDIRSLIEAMYADQMHMQMIVNDEASPFDEFLPVLNERQDLNLTRGGRLEQMLKDALARLAAATQPANATQPAAPDQNAQLEQQRHELALSLLSQLMQTFTQTKTALQPGRHEEAKTSIDRGIKQLEALRRLFFSIVEHLKETAQRQTELNDDTRDAATLENAPIQPLADRQQELTTISREIARSLTEQSRQHGLPAGTGQGQNAADAGTAQDAAAQLAQAGKVVDEAANAMDEATAKLSADPPDPKTAAEPQQTALAKLMEAILLLEPPRQQPQQNQQDQQQNQDGGDQPQEDQEQQQQQQQQQQQMDLRHLLQSVRDRAAQRERDRRREPVGYQPVEKDW